MTDMHLYRKFLFYLTLAVVTSLPFSTPLAQDLSIHVHDDASGRSLAGVSIFCSIHISDTEILCVETVTTIEGLAWIDMDRLTGVSSPLVRRPPLNPQSSPNPAGGIANIRFQVTADKSLDQTIVSLYDLRGRRLSQGLLVDSILPLPAQGLPAGVYLIQARDRNSGTTTHTKLTAIRRLREIRLNKQVVSVGEEKDDRHLVRIDLSLERLDYLPSEMSLEAATFPVQVSAPMERQNSQGSLNSWVFSTIFGWNQAAVDSGWLPAVADTAQAFERRLAFGDGPGLNLASLSSSEPDQIYCHNGLIKGRGAAVPNEGVAVLPLVRFDLSCLPEDITIEEAWLIASPVVWSNFPAADGSWHQAIFNCWQEDESWIEACPNLNCDTEFLWRQTSWQDPGGLEGAWYPPLDQRDTWEDYGILSEPIHTVVAGGEACRYDVKRALQFYCDHREQAGNAGFILSNTKNANTYFVAAGPGAGDHQPILLVRWREQPRIKPWNGFPLAFSFGTDDGDMINMEYADICEDHGFPYTLYIMRRGIREEEDPRPKLTAPQCNEILSRGNRLGHHSTNHLSTWGLGEITWGAVDSIHAEVTRTTWVDSLFGSGSPDTMCSVGSFAYPSGGITLWAIKNLVKHQFLFARGAGNGESWTYPLWGGAGLKTHLSWLDPVNLYALAITNHSLLVGYDDETPGLDEIRWKLRHQTALLLNQGQAALITFCHADKESDYSGGIDPHELDMLLTAVQESDFYWMSTLQDIVTHYRQHHVPVNPASSSFAIAAYDSLIQAGHQEFLKVWWLPTD